VIVFKNLPVLMLAALPLLVATHTFSQQAPAVNEMEAIDRIVAVANEEVITRKELNDQYKTAVRQLQKQGVALPPREVLEKQLLERVILSRLQLQIARESGLRVSDDQLDKTLQRIAQDNGMTPSEFRFTLEREGITFEKFREEIRTEILLARLKEREIDNKIVITDIEVSNHIRTEETASGKIEEYRISHLLVRVAENATLDQTEARRQRAETALAKLAGGEAFAKVAAEFSDASDAQEGGVLDWRPLTRLAPVFVEALTNMRVGETTPLLRSPNGFHILRLLERRGGDPATFISQTHARHILVKISELVSAFDANQRIVQLKARLNKGESFTELAKRYSEDGSAAAGGDLNWLSAGETVPEFEKAMDALKPGQISEPVQTPFGWHLIEVLERRDQDVTLEKKRQAARQAIRARKSDEAYQDWLRQLRDQAYVEYRLEER